MNKMHTEFRQIPSPMLSVKLFIVPVIHDVDASSAALVLENIFQP